MAQVTQRSEIRARVRGYLQKAHDDGLNTHNFPIRGERIAEDLGLPLNMVVAAADELAKMRQVERIARVFGPTPSYRMFLPRAGRRASLWHVRKRRGPFQNGHAALTRVLNKGLDTAGGMALKEESTVYLADSQK